MDTIGDFCSIIRNGHMAGKDKVDMPASNMRKKLAGKLEQYGYIRGWRAAEDGRQGIMRVYLKYKADQSPAIQGIQRVSRPSCRRYAKSGDLLAHAGRGITIVSASCRGSGGIFSGEEAKKKGVGGEILCQVW